MLPNIFSQDHHDKIQLELTDLLKAFPAGRFFTYAQKCQYCHFHLYYMKTKNSSDKMLPPMGIEPRPLIASDSKYNINLSTLC